MQKRRGVFLSFAFVAMVLLGACGGSNQNSSAAPTSAAPGDGEPAGTNPAPPPATPGDVEPGGPAAGEPAHGEPASAALVDCAPARVLCRRRAPSCPEGQVPSVQGTCYGACVAIERCACTAAEQCPSPDRYTCHHQTSCGPFLR